MTSTHVTVEPPKLHGATRAPGAALVLLAAALLATWIWSADRGLDRVDESYVLAYIAHPDASRPAPSGGPNAPVAGTAPAPAPTG